MRTKESRTPDAGLSELGRNRLHEAEPDCGMRVVGVTGGRRAGATGARGELIRIGSSGHRAGMSAVSDGPVGLSGQAGDPLDDSGQVRLFDPGPALPPLSKRPIGA